MSCMYSVHPPTSETHEFQHMFDDDELAGVCCAASSPLLQLSGFVSYAEHHGPRTASPATDSCQANAQPSDGNRQAVGHGPHADTPATSHSEKEKGTHTGTRVRRRQQRSQLQALEDKAASVREEYERLSRENALLKKKLQVLEQVIPWKDVQVNLLARRSDSASLFEQASVTEPPSTSAPSVSAVPNLLPSPHAAARLAEPGCIESLKGLTSDQCRSIYKALVFEVSALIVACDVHSCNSHHSHNSTKLSTWLPKAISIMERLALFHQESFVGIMNLNMETGHTEKPNEEFWCELVRSISLTPQQCKDMDAMLTLFESTMLPVREERKQLVDEITTKLANARLLNAELDLLGAGVAEVACHLSKNVQKEHMTLCSFGNFASNKVFTHYQFGKMLAGSYPYMPDGSALLHACRRVHNQGSPAAHQ